MGLTIIAKPDFQSFWHLEAFLVSNKKLETWLHVPVSTMCFVKMTRWTLYSTFQNILTANRTEVWKKNISKADNSGGMLERNFYTSSLQRKRPNGFWGEDWYVKSLQTNGEPTPSDDKSSYSTFIKWTKYIYIQTNSNDVSLYRF